MIFASFFIDRYIIGVSPAGKMTVFEANGWVFVSRFVCAVFKHIFVCQLDRSEHKGFPVIIRTQQTTRDNDN